MLIFRRAARLLAGGGLLAHDTGTIPGVATLPTARGVRRMQRFKQRRGPFLLLADSLVVARRLALWFPNPLRQLMIHWPGPLTLLFKARPGLPAACYQRGYLAVRVDSDPEVRRLAKACGGLLLSSSLNRRGQPWQVPTRRLRWRWRRHLAGVLPSRQPVDLPRSPSTLLKVSRSSVRRLR